MNVNTMVQQSSFSETLAKIKERDKRFRGVREIRYTLDVSKPECHAHQTYCPYKPYPENILY